MFFKEKEKKSKAFCPCGHEILQDPDSKVYEGGTFTNIICNKCGTQSTWDLDAPVPIYIERPNQVLDKCCCVPYCYELGVEPLNV